MCCRFQQGEDGVEAVLAREFRPEVVLLDLGMPGMDGFEVARRLRASVDGGSLKIVAQTGWGQEEDRRRTREAGFDEHLAKPVDMAALRQVLQAPSTEFGLRPRTRR